MSMTYHIEQSNKFTHRAIERKYIKGKFTSTALSRPQFDSGQDDLSEHVLSLQSTQYVLLSPKKKSVSTKMGRQIMKKVCREKFSYIEGPQLAI